MKNKRDKAKARVEFQIHLFVYIAVITLLAVINLFKSPDQLWFIWPMLGWGIGLVAHALRVYFFSGEQSLKERMIEKEMKKSN